MASRRQIPADDVLRRLGLFDALQRLLRRGEKLDDVTLDQLRATARRSPSVPTRTDRIKEHVTERDLDAARRELNGEVVARKPDGTPWDHVDEVRNAQRGLANRIEQLKRQLQDTRLSDADRATAQDELTEASKLLDRTKGYVPWPP